MYLTPQLPRHNVTLASDKWDWVKKSGIMYKYWWTRASVCYVRGRVYGGGRAEVTDQVGTKKAVKNTMLIILRSSYGHVLHTCLDSIIFVRFIECIQVCVCVSAERVKCYQTCFPKVCLEMGADTLSGKNGNTLCTVCISMWVRWTRLMLLYAVHDMYLQRVHIWGLVLALRTA